MRKTGEIGGKGRRLRVRRGRADLLCLSQAGAGRPGVGV